MDSQAFTLSQFASNCIEALEKNLGEEHGIVRAALLGVFRALQHLALLTTSRIDEVFHDALHHQLGEGQQTLSQFAKGLAGKVDPTLPAWAKPILLAVLTNLETVAETTPTPVDDIVLAILSGILHAGETEAATAA